MYKINTVWWENVAVIMFGKSGWMQILVEKFGE